MRDGVPSVEPYVEAVENVTERFSVAMPNLFLSKARSNARGTCRAASLPRCMLGRSNSRLSKCLCKRVTAVPLLLNRSVVSVNVLFTVMTRRAVSALECNLFLRLLLRTRVRKCRRVCGLMQRVLTFPGLQTPRVENDTRLIGYLVRLTVIPFVFRVVLMRNSVL